MTGGWPDLLRQVRISRGLSQREVAARAGMSASTLSRIERGVDPLFIETLMAIADALGAGEDVRQWYATATGRGPS